ncbi:cyclophilin-like domain-containing protein [Ochromonadaceae sp. CCMP2298]|nr:cyclophilin-like domain-containing protein [Ochromonadaceae sp. CCMP2298]
MVVFKVLGSVHETEVFFCHAIAQKIASSLEDCKVTMEVMFEVDFFIKMREMSKINSALIHHKASHIVFRDDKVIGDVKALTAMALKEYGILDAEVNNTILFNRLVRENSYDMMKARNRPVVYMKFANSGITRESFGVLQIELFSELCPKACENFKFLCEGVGIDPNVISYKNCRVHRIVKNGWIQTGDVIDGSGANSTAVLDLTEIVPDESFSVDFGFFAGGVVGFANDGSHSSGSQFFITMGPAEWMNKNFVGIGRVLQGFSTLRQLNIQPTSNQSPVGNLVIEDCGTTQIE